MKINVATTVGDTYRFLATYLLSIFRIGWLPVALMLFVTEVTGEIAETPEDPAFWIDAFAQILAAVIVVLGCLRITFGRRADLGAPGYFVFEGTELRYLIAWSLIVAVVGALVTGIVAASGLDGEGNGTIGTVGFLALIAVLVWAGLRLVPQPAVILNDGGLGFARAWRMTRGNTLRLGAATLLCVGPVWALDNYAYHLVAGTWPTFPVWTWTLVAAGDTATSYFDWYEQVVVAHPLTVRALNFVRYVLEYAVTAGLIASVYTQLNANK